MGVTISISDPTDALLPDVWRFAARAEAAGFHGIGRPDHQDRGRDVFLELAACAAHTTRLVLYPAVSNPLTRSPGVLAAVTNSLAEAAPGRVRLIMGAGDISARHAGKPPATMHELGATATAVRDLLAGHPTRLGTSAAEVMQHRPVPAPPVLVSASSPRAIEVAGESADGAFLMVGAHPAMIEAALRHLRAGAERAGRDIDARAVLWGLPVFVDEDAARARARARGVLALWLSRPRRIFGVEATRLGLVRGPVRGPEDVPQEALASLCDAFGLVGTPAHAAERLQRLLTETPVRDIHCQLYGGLDQLDATMRVFERYLLPAAKGAAAA